nr:RNA-directed DNA polymerase, eukaryota, reverse transcriptase zinc-binding domain protein [Tanacetum cinerariifolium]
MILKVDFDKAYDSVRWDYLDEVLKKFGFGDKWRVWIKSCLSSSRGSILVNGCPTKEFQFIKALNREIDPLSPFLFLLIMESLHLSFQQVVNEGLFKGVSIGSSLHVSHLFYADDVVFMGQLSDSNILTIVHALDCFFQAYGLRINMHKSKLKGIAVDVDKVNRAAKTIGCLTFKTPFSYLGIKVGGLMSRISSWDEIVNKLLSRLSRWKLKTLSIGGRLTLLKSVLGSTPIYYMSLFKVPMQSRVLASKKKGGLSVSSFFALNRALMFKWVWHFRNDSRPLWDKVIKAIHGEEGNLGMPNKPCFPSTWMDIVREMSKLKNQGIDLLGLIKKELEAILNGFQLPVMQDRWFWSLESSSVFTVASVKRCIDDKMLPDVSSKTRWVKAVPIKVNVLAWKISQDGLPTRLNLSRRELSSYGEWVVWVSNIHIPLNLKFYWNVSSTSCGGLCGFLGIN